VTTTAKRNAIQQAYLDHYDLWIDGSDAAQEGTWRTEDGQTVTIPFMSPSTIPEPNGGTAANCLFIDTDELGDYPCTASMGYICEVGKVN